ncbi:MAG: sterol desaturase/sphingolipid hydroxylase (fatty acid hydroxylase superfamily) [Myxococcota bacterium]|jgi:sterol desaturase/sphingolipid hydroxylase (fatty acid hydroxylase superfamily)
MGALAVVLMGLLLGVFAWSFAEYALHNWVGHLGKGKNHFSREHLQHHAKGDYFAPAVQKALAAIVTASLVLPLAALSVGWLGGASFTVGLVGMYLVYERLHYRSHFAPPRTAYGRWVRKNHFAHHFTAPKKNHGVTSPLWDYVFGTHQAEDVVRVPEKLALVWLVDPETGDAREEFGADYRITRTRRSRQST